MSEERRTRVKNMSGAFVGKSVDEATGQALLRYVFTSDKLDEVGDIITKAATEEATERWREWRNIRFQHDPNRPIGKAVRIGKSDGIEWNEMDVRIDDPSVLPLTAGDDPVLGAASVGIIVRDYEVNDDEEARARAYWEPWVITAYDFVEISLVDHPANYDAKLVGEVEAGRSALLFRRNDILQKEGGMNPEPEETTPVEGVDKSVEEQNEEALIEVQESADESVAELAIEPEVEKQEEGDPTLAGFDEIKSLLAEMRDTLAAKMDEIHGAVTKSVEPEEAVEEPVVEQEDVDEEPVPMDLALEDSAEVEPVAETDPEPVEPVSEYAMLSQSVKEIRDLLSEFKVGGDEAESEEPNDLEKLVDAKVKEAMEKMKLTGRKSAVVADTEEEAEAETEDEPNALGQLRNPQEKLRKGVAQALQNRITRG